MRDIADKLLVLLLVLKLLVRRFLEAQPHVLIVAVKLTDLALLLRRQHIFQIAFGDILHRDIQLVDRRKDPFLDPLRQHQTGKNKYQNKGNDHIPQYLPGDQGTHARHDKEAAPAAVRKSKVGLFDKFLHIVIIIACLHIRHLDSIFGKRIENLLCGIKITSIVDAVLFSHNNIGKFAVQMCTDLIKIVFVFEPDRIAGDLFLHLMQQILRDPAVILDRIGKRDLIHIQKPQLPFCILDMAAHQKKGGTRQHKRQQHDNHRCDHKSCFKLQRDVPLFYLPLSSRSFPVHQDAELLPQVYFVHLINNIPYFLRIGIKHIL